MFWVSTTVIEVESTYPMQPLWSLWMQIGFGLNDQLRGRVGRGNKQSYAILVANPKTDKVTSA